MRRRTSRVAVDAARTLSAAAQMALLCPSGMDVWVRRQLGGSRDGDRLGARRAP